MTSPVRPDLPVRIGVQLQPQHAPHYRNLRDAVRRCEDIGVDIAFTWDHFFPLYGDPDGPHCECWTVLAAWDIWHSFTSADQFPAKSAVLSQHCADVGRDPASIQRSAAAETLCRWRDKR
jgi:hypothetical protein